MVRRVGGLTAFLLAAAAALIATAASAEKRVALVIGNSSYQTLGVLKNPAHDSQDIASALDSSGFDVTERVNLGGAEMREAIDDFATRAAAADLAVFYYAGHGLQMSSRNYLVPVDAKLDGEEAVRKQTLELGEILDSLRNGIGATIVILDACRDNPVPGTTEGLAPPDLPPDFLVAYSAAPGRVAYDGGGRNSPFASAMLQYFPKPGQNVSDLLIATRRDVMLATGAQQLPTDWSTLSRQVVFAPGEPEAFPPETRLWHLAAGGPDRDLLNIYLQRFPDGPHIEDVRSMLTGLDGGQAGPPAQPPEQDAEAVEELLWSLAKGERLQRLVELYLARYPDGKHKTEAATLLASLTPADDVSPDVRCELLATHPNDATARVAGVPGRGLAENRDERIAACRAAAAAFPDNPHFTALLARAIAGGRPRGEPIPDEAIELYEDAAERGDARAMISLALVKQAGNGVAKDVDGALKLLETASALGHPDGKIERAFLFLSGEAGPKNLERAVALYREAADAGSGMAAYNLGTVIAENGAGDPKDAFAHFERAAQLGFPGGYLAAAILLDEGRGVARNSEAAADYILTGVATDSGEAFQSIYKEAATWRRETVEAVQRRLRDAGYYTGAIDGRSGPKFGAALDQWRLFGPPSPT